MAAKLWEDVRKSLQDIGNRAAEKSREFSKVAADKAEELTKKGKVRMEILQTNREIERQFAELGGRVYHLYSDDKLGSIQDDQDVQVLFDKISVLEEKKEAQEERLEEMRKAEATGGTEAETETGSAEGSKQRSAAGSPEEGNEDQSAEDETEPQK